MTNNGKAQVSAPKCTTTSITVSPAPNNAKTVFSTGDTTSSGAYTAPAAGTDATTLSLTQRSGFLTSANTIIVAPGTDKEEEATGTAAATDGAGNFTITSTNANGDTALNFSHGAGTRVIVKRSALRPGSVTFKEGAAAAVALDPDGDGSFSGVDVGTGILGGTIDYATGSVNIVATTAPNGASTIAGDKLADNPADLVSGKNYFKNFDRMSNGRADLPTGAVISNLGSAEVGVFVETADAQNASQFEGTPSASTKIAGFGSKVLTFPGGLPAEMRIRAGVSSTANMTPSTATERNNDPGVIDVAYFSVINANGGSN